MTERIGTIELLRMRVYNLDAYAHDPGAQTVVVEPGHYGLYRDGDTTYWVMRGKLNMRIWRIGDGTFMALGSDEPSDVEVVFPSRRFGPDEWVELLASPELTDGSAGQRLRVRLDGGES